MFHFDWQNYPKSLKYIALFAITSTTDSNKVNVNSELSQVATNPLIAPLLIFMQTATRLQSTSDNLLAAIYRVVASSTSVKTSNAVKSSSFIFPSDLNLRSVQSFQQAVHAFRSFVSHLVNVKIAVVPSFTSVTLHAVSSNPSVSHSYTAKTVAPVMVNIDDGHVLKLTADDDSEMLATIGVLMR